MLKNVVAADPAPGPRRPATAEEARALSSPVRLRIIREVFDAPLTNNQIAARLGRDKATVLHHVRALVDTGFLEALPPRAGPRGSRERPYRSTGKSWRLDVSDYPHRTGIEDAMLGAFLEEVPDAAKRSTSRLALRLTASRREELEQRLDQILREYADHPPDPDGDSLAVFLTIYLRSP